MMKFRNLVNDEMMKEDDEMMKFRNLVNDEMMK